LLGMPVVVGTSEAVMATRRTLGAWARAPGGEGQACEGDGGAKAQGRAP
jgi:hypothetical protein